MIENQKGKIRKPKRALPSGQRLLKPVEVEAWPRLPQSFAKSPSGALGLLPLLSYAHPPAPLPRTADLWLLGSLNVAPFTKLKRTLVLPRTVPHTSVGFGCLYQACSILALGFPLSPLPLTRESKPWWSDTFDLVRNGPVCSCWGFGFLLAMSLKLDCAVS